MRRTLLALTLLVACLAPFALAAPTASAQPRGDFSVMRFTPAPGPGNYFMTDGAAVRGHMTGSAGLLIDYAHQPFSLYDATCNPDGTNCHVSGTATQIVQYTAAAHLFGTLALFDRLQIGLILPLAITEGQPFTPLSAMGMGISGTTGPVFAVGDARLHLKVNFLDDHSSGFRLGAVVYGTAPIGHAMAPGRYVGDETPTVGGHLTLELVNSGLHVAGNIGGIWRDGQTLYSTQAGGQLTDAFAMGYDITPLVDVFAEVNGATSFSSQVDENSLEARLGARLRVDDVVFSLGGGAGLIAGVGVPVFRALGGFMWAPVSSDEDGDGIPDAIDSCPSEAEDIDDFDDADGCPDQDNDGDGINDGFDTCPNDPEDMDGEDDGDGCPDIDTDGDGIHDGYDSCPTEPEDMDGDRDEDGCPDNDRDRDNIDDSVDQCPDEPEDTDGFGDEDGCPEVDFDGDSIPDDSDQCPDQAEDPDGFEDEDGCPEDGGPPPAEEDTHGRHHRGR